MKLPELNTNTILSALVITGIGTIGSMIATSWSHRCARKTMKLEMEIHRRWNAHVMYDEDDQDE